jgi:hypothetical protein
MTGPFIAVASAKAAASDAFLACMDFGGCVHWISFSILPVIFFFAEHGNG